METCKVCSAPERRRPALPNAKKLGGVTWQVWARPTGLPTRAACEPPASRLRAAARDAAQMGRQKHHADDEFGRSCYFYPGTNTKNLMNFWVIVTFNLVFIQFFWQFTVKPVPAAMTV